MARRTEVQKRSGEDEDDTIIMSVKLASGKFESSISVPLYATPEEKKNFVESWLNMMEMGIRVGEANRAAPQQTTGEDRG